MQKIDFTSQQKGAQTAEQTFALTRASSACGGYFDLMLNAPRLDCSFPFAFFLACGNATCGIRGGTDGQRLMHQTTEHVISIGTHRSSLSRTDLARVTLCWHRGESGDIACRQLCTILFSASPLDMGAGLEIDQSEKILGG